jgi:hypothetical protein
MAARIACLALALALFPVNHSNVWASHERQSAGEVEVLVNGTPQPQYAHAGRSYVEALKGHEYAIRLRNPYGVRVAVALSVDGLNTIDARHTTAADARKWVLGPYQTLDVVGWQTSRQDARRFEFTTEERSYGRALGTTDHLGVISAVFFKERPRPVVAEQSRDSAAMRSESSAPSAAPAEERAAGSPARQAVDDYAATGMGDRTHNPIVQVHIDLENTPARTVNIRYEYRPQLVRLGILPEASEPDPLTRRERARGFEPGFSPVVK